MDIQVNFTNKVAESSLISLDLASYYPAGERVVFDIKDQLFQGLMLREKDFREFVKTHNWSLYATKHVAIHCSTDAIVPTWAYMLVSSKLHGIAAFVSVGSKEALEKEMIKQTIEGMDVTSFKEGRVIIKGCSDISSPEYAMSLLVQRLQPVVKSIMYGEPCSTVPVYKRK